MRRKIYRENFLVKTVVIIILIAFTYRGIEYVPAILVHTISLSEERIESDIEKECRLISETGYTLKSVMTNSKEKDNETAYMKLLLDVEIEGTQGIFTCPSEMEYVLFKGEWNLLSYRMLSVSAKPKGDLTKELADEGMQDCQQRDYQRFWWADYDVEFDHIEKISDTEQCAIYRCNDPEDDGDDSFYVQLNYSFIGQLGEDEFIDDTDDEYFNHLDIWEEIGYWSLQDIVE